MLIFLIGEVEAINQDSKDVAIVVGQPQLNATQEGTTKTQSSRGKPPMPKSKLSCPEKPICATLGLNVKSKGAGDLLNKVL